ncbi:MAG: electron transfer flavoprotein subunit beta/FixA family protein [Desulfoplanes sp.]
MEILVCIKRVPDTAENEIELNSTGNDLNREDLVYSINDWDNYAVEEAIQIVDRVGGNVTVVTLGDEESKEVLRRELAMGANNALFLSDDAFGRLDGRGVATVLEKVVKKGNYDLILTGVQADDGASQIGGMLAAMLDYPYASVVNSIAIKEDKVLEISRETEGGNLEISQINMPCVLSIQTGINEPRYVGIRGIRKVASVEIPTLTTDDLGLDTLALKPRTTRLDYFVPELGESAEMLQGSTEEIITTLIGMLKAKGGLK